MSCVAQTAIFVVALLLASARAQCGNSVVNGDEECDGGACCTNQCKFAAASTICRAAPLGATCAQADRCTGSSAVCYPSAPLAAGTVCRSAVNVCDVADRCDGLTTACADRKAVMGTVCPNLMCEGNSICDGQGTCIGRSYDCPCAGQTTTAPGATTPRPPPTLATPAPTVVNCAGCGNSGYLVGSANWCRCCSTQPACQQMGRPNIYNQASCVSTNGFCSSQCLLNAAPNPEYCSDVANLPTPAPTTTRAPMPTPIVGSPECNLDRNTCTLESCVAGSGCLVAGNAPIGSTCNDGDDCTADDRCAAGGRCGGTNNCLNNCSGHGTCCRSQCTCDKTYTGADCGSRANGGLLGEGVSFPTGTMRISLTNSGAITILPGDGSRGTATVAPVVAALTAQGAPGARLSVRGGNLGVESGDRCSTAGACVSVASDCWGSPIGQQSCRAGSVCCVDGNVNGALVNGNEQLVVNFQHANGTAMRVQLVYAELSGVSASSRVSFLYTTASGDPVVPPTMVSDAVFVGPPRAITGMTVQAISGQGFSLDALTVRQVSASETITQAPTMAPTTPAPLVTTTRTSVSESTTVSAGASTTGSDSTAVTATSGGSDSTTGTDGQSTDSSSPVPILTPPPGGLSGGAIAGIVIGVLAALVLIGLLVFFLLRRRAANADAEKGTAKPTQPPTKAADDKPTTKVDEPAKASEADTAFLSPMSSPGTSPRDPPPISPRKPKADDDTAAVISAAVVDSVGGADAAPTTASPARRKRTIKRRGSTTPAAETATNAAAEEGTEMTETTTTTATTATTTATTTKAAETEETTPKTTGSRASRHRKEKEASSGDVTASSRQSRKKAPKPSKRNLLEAETPPPASKPEDKEAAGGLQALLAGQIDVDDAFKTLERETSKKPSKK